MEKIVLFFNNKGNGAANQPYFTGKIKFPDGTEKKVSLWSQVSQSGQTYYSGNTQPITAEGYRNIVPPPAPAQPDQPAPTDPALTPAQDQPETKDPDAEPASQEFINDQIKAWEDRTKSEFPDLGRRRLEAPRQVEQTNQFWRKTSYILAKDLIHKVENTPLEIMNEADYQEYKRAILTVAAYEAQQKELFSANGQGN
jgi:hypothetical protein